MQRLTLISDTSCNPTPSLNRFGQDPLQGRAWCTWPHSTVVLTCDGTVVCGCGDAFNENPMGDARTQSVLDIWRGEGFQSMRRGMRDGNPAPFCYKCGLMEIHPADFEPPDLPLVPDTHPRHLYVEPTIICNLRCPQPACVPEEVYDTRSVQMLPVDVYKKVLDEVGPHLEGMVFYNYGESFIHKDAFEMIRYAKDVNPNIWIWTSTNGHYFNTPEKVHALLDSGIDEIQFSIDGSTQEVYEQYRKRGCLDTVLDGMRAVVEERERRGTPGPWILWNYILFRWNDSDEQMEHARSLAMEIGVDRLTWTTTDQPLGMPSTRFVPGSPDYDLIQPGLLGGGLASPNAIRWHASIQALDLPSSVRAGDAVVARVRVRNEGEVRWPSASERTTRPVRVCGRMQSASGGYFGQPFLVGSLPRAVEPGESVDVEMLGFVDGPPGEFEVKVDVVLGERIWFEEFGGEPLIREIEISDTGISPPLLELVSSPSTVRAGEAFEVAVRVQGRLNGSIDGAQAAAHRGGIGIRWVPDAPDADALEGPRCYFEPPLGPGQVRDLRLSVPAGSLAPGRWSGKLDLVREEMTWLEDLGFEPLRLDLTVEGSPDDESGRDAPDAVHWRAGIQAIDLPASVCAGDAVVARVRIRNEGEVRWPSPLERNTEPVRVYGRMQSASGRISGQPFLVGGLPRAVAPGESVDVEMLGFAGGPPGQFQVKVDLLLGESLWFEDVGGEPLVCSFEVSSVGSSPPLLELVSSPPTVRAGEAFEVTVRVQGRLNGTIDGSLAAMHRGGVGIRWIPAEADARALEEPRCYFEPPLGPGQVRELRLPVSAGSLTPGRWSGKLDLVREGLTWLEDLGFEPLRLDLTVTP